MKIYFAYSKSISEENLNHLKEYFSKKDHTVLNRSFSTSNSNITAHDAEKMFKENVKMIKLADVVVAECSSVSTGIGYDIALSLQEKKPVIAIYNLEGDTQNKNVTIDLKGNNNKYLILKEYKSNNIEKVLDIALNDAKALIDTKFILIIPPQIDRYLEWNARERGKAKAEVTREAIESVMLCDTKYKDYLKANEID